MYILKLSHKGSDGIYHEGNFFSGFGMAYRSEYEIFEPVLETRVNSVGHFSFTIYPTHPLYEFVNQPKAVLEVARYGISEPLFVGRMAECVTGLYNEKMLTFESELSFLLDSVRTNFNSEAGYGCEYWLDEILEYHNTHAGNFGSVYTENIGRKFKCGRVSESIKVRCTNIPAETFKGSFSTLDIIRKLLLEKYGGVLKIRHEGGVNYVDWLDESDLHVCSQKIELASNLLNIENSVTTDQIVTAIRPTGENVSKNGESVPLDISLTDVSGYISDDDIFQVTDDTVSASSSLHFTDTLYSQDLVNRYGWICREVYFAGVKSVADLTKKAVNYLNGVGQKQSIILNAADLSQMNNSIENFLAGDMAIVNSPVHSFFENRMLIASVIMNLADLTAGEIVLGNDTESITSQVSTGGTGSLAGVFSGGSYDYSESIKAAFEEAKSYTDNSLESKVDKQDGKSLSSNDFTDAYKSQVDTNKSDISALKTKTDNTNTEVAKKANSVDVYTKFEVIEIIAQKIAEIVAGAPEDFDTLKEMSDWLLNHEDTAAAMNTAITKNAQDIASAELVNKARFAEHTSEIEALQSGVDSLEASVGYMSEHKADKTAVTANANKISALDERVTANENSISSNASNINALGASVTNLQNADVEFSKNIASVNQTATIAKSRADNALERVAALEDDNDVQKATNAEHLARITANKSDTTIIKTTLGYQKKNLMKLSYATGYTHTNAAKSVTWTFNSDYSVSMVVTTALTSGMALEHSRITLQPGTYIYSVEGYSTPNITHTQLYKMNADGSGAFVANLSAIESTITVTEEAVYSFRAYRNAAVTVNVTETFFPMLRYADITDDTYEPYVKSVKERLETQSQLYSSTTGGSSPLTVTVSNLFADYSAVICNMVTSNGNYSIVLPLKYVKALGASTYYETEGLLFYYVDNSTMTIRTGLGQSNPTINSVKIIGLY